MSPQNRRLRESVLADVLRIMDLTRFDGAHPFHGITNQLLFWLSRLKPACSQVERDEEGLHEVWACLSDKINRITLSKTLVQMAEQTFSRAGLDIPRADGACAGPLDVGDSRPSRG